MSNGYHKYAHRKYDSSKESFEEVPMVTACLTYLGFFLLMVLGYVNQMFFTPKVATEKYRDVSKHKNSKIDNLVIEILL